MNYATEHETNLDELGALVARELGEGWTVKTPESVEHFTRVAHCDGYAFTILRPSWARTPGKYHVSADCPKGPGPNGPQHRLGAYNEPYSPSINVSATKSPAQIAADIKRRLLPDYITAWNRVTDQLNNTRAAFAEKLRVLDTLATAAPWPMQRTALEAEHVAKLHYYSQHSSCDIQVFSDDVKLELRCSVGHAARILRALHGAA